MTRSTLHNHVQKVSSEVDIRYAEKVVSSDSLLQESKSYSKVGVGCMVNTFSPRNWEALSPILYCRQSTRCLSLSVKLTIALGDDLSGWGSSLSEKGGSLEERNRGGKRPLEIHSSLRKLEVWIRLGYGKLQAPQGVYSPLILPGRESLR
jgi:hypothetical protein